MKDFVKSLLRRCGYDVVRYVENIRYPLDFTEEEKEICNVVAPFTMTSIERIVALIRATKYIAENDIQGDIVECGVWRGGSMMVCAHVLQRLGNTTHTLYLFDTFEGMSVPTVKDKQFDGIPAEQLLSMAGKGTGIWCHADKHDVMANLLSTGYPADNVRFVEGKIEETIPQTLPERICLLRLDTDWYESTKHALIHLYPRLVGHGVLIIDDYGHWRGAREATDAYFQQSKTKPFLNRIDYTGRLLIKTEG